jgi:hypothetical protein
VTAIKLPGSNENDHTLESAEIVACALGVLALFELMFCDAHAAKITAAMTGKIRAIRNGNSILPVLNNMSVPHRHGAYCPHYRALARITAIAPTDLSGGIDISHRNKQHNWISK